MSLSNHRCWFEAPQPDAGPVPEPFEAAPDLVCVAEEDDAEDADDDFDDDDFDDDFEEDFDDDFDDDLDDLEDDDGEDEEEDGDGPPVDAGSEEE